METPLYPGRGRPVWGPGRTHINAFASVPSGAGRLAPAVVADAILDGVMDFINSGSAKTIQTVKVVIFQQHMLNDFYMSLKKKEGTPLSGPKSFLNKITGEVYV